MVRDQRWPPTANERDAALAVRRPCPCRVSATVTEFYDGDAAGSGDRRVPVWRRALRIEGAAERRLLLPLHDLPTELRQSLQRDIAVSGSGLPAHQGRAQVLPCQQLCPARLLRRLRCAGGLLRRWRR